jgi:hypothetical protein
MDIGKSTVLEIIYKTLSPKKIETSLICGDKKIIEDGKKSKLFHKRFPCLLKE